MKKRERDAASDNALSLECEAFLTGALAEHWDERGTPVPVWAWTNLLAHGSAEEIAESVNRPLRPKRTGRSWRIARSYLAYQVLDATDTQFTLEDLQHSVLVPLELELAAHPEVNRWTPRHWVDAVDDAIRNQHSTLGL